MDKIVADDRARGGTKGSPVLIVLVAALVLCGIALTGFMMWTGSQSPTSSQQAASERSTATTSSTNSSRVPAENPAYPVPAAPKSGMQGSAAPKP
jgi:flagellar basal body-associated protein FliL